MRYILPKRLRLETFGSDEWYLQGSDPEKVVATGIKRIPAARLALCWNSHDALVGALSGCIGILNECAKQFRSMDMAGGHEAMAEMHIERAKQALSQAKGE